MNKTIRIALAGNPNSGKSTIFNALTGGRAHIGNYPGVTVEKKVGELTHAGRKVEIVDLPGTYSLTAFSVDEIVTRDYLVSDEADVVVAIADAANLERNLYLVTQLIELGANLVVALNKWDLARARGTSVDVGKLSQLVGVPIVTTVGTEEKGIGELLDAALRAAEEGGPVSAARLPRYGHEVEPHVRQMTDAVRNAGLPDRHARWFALKLLEDDPHTRERVEQLAPDAAERLFAESAEQREHIREMCGDDPEIILADRRYGFISGACTEAVELTVEARHERSDKIDAVLLNRYVGLPIFALVMFVLFQLTFAIGNPMVDFLDAQRGRLAEWVLAVGGDGLLISLLADGIIEGVGAVIVFVPLIALLYIGISILEDSGYMARAAFVMDALMHKVGLHGKSVLPMLVGFGCTVPAVMATRILESRRDRLTTILVLPLMSCGARLPVYVLIIGAFFGNRVLFTAFGLPVRAQGLILFAVYAVGIVLALIATKIFRSTLLRGESTSFVMELPPYRVPAGKGVARHVGERTWEYLRKAGTIIFAICIVLWALKTWPQLPDERVAAFEQQQAQILADAGVPPETPPEQLPEPVAERFVEVELAQQAAAMQHSAIGRVGTTLAPIFRPAGLDWRVTTALVASFAAKEVFITQMGVIYAVEEAGEESETLRGKLRADYSALTGVSILLFVLISAPCMGTVAVTLRESGSWKWALLQWGYLTVLAWGIATLVYQVGNAFGGG